MRKKTDRASGAPNQDRIWLDLHKKLCSKITSHDNIIFMSGHQISNTPIGAFLTQIGEGTFINGLRTIVDESISDCSDPTYTDWRRSVLNETINPDSDQFSLLSEALGEELSRKLLHTSVEDIPNLVQEYKHASEQEALESSLPTAEASGLLRDILKSAKTLLSKTKQFQEIWPNLVKEKLSPLLGALKVLNQENADSQQINDGNPLLNFASQEIDSVVQHAKSIKQDLEPKMKELTQLGRAFSQVLPK